MDRLKYKMSDYSKDFLQSKGFKYNRTLSNSSDDIYTYRFPLITYNKNILVECEIIVSCTTGTINVNVLSTGTKELYASYYNRDYGNNELLKSIDKKIENKLKDLGIKQL